MGLQIIGPEGEDRTTIEFARLLAARPSYVYAGGGTKPPISAAQPAQNPAPWRPSRMPQFTKPGSKCAVRSVARHGFRSTILLLDEGYGGGQSAHAVADRPGRGCQALRNSPTADAR